MSDCISHFSYYYFIISQTYVAPYISEWWSACSTWLNHQVTALVDYSPLLASVVAAVAPFAVLGMQNLWSLASQYLGVPAEVAQIIGQGIQQAIEQFAQKIQNELEVRFHLPTHVAYS
jgi:hypothetical protein